jgi:hypothetical protein
MGLPGRKSCEETLHLLASSGYTLHDLAMPDIVYQYGECSDSQPQLDRLV